MDIRQLRYFIRVVETKSLTKAAEQLHLAQPALGLQIRKLEEELGVSLVIRHSRGVEPTDAGLQLFEDAKAIVDRVNATIRRLKDFSSVPHGRVTLGVTPSVSTVLAAGIVHRCSEAFPSISLNMIEDVSAILLDRVEAGEIDIACAYKMVHDSARLVFEPLVDEDIYFVTGSKEYPRAAGPIALADVAARPLIMPGAPHGLRQLLEEQAEAQGLSLNVAFEIQSVNTTRALAVEGLADTVLPYGAVRREVEAGVLRAFPIGEPSIARTLYLVRPLREQEAKARIAVGGLIRELVSDEIARPGGFWRSPRP